MFTIVDSYFRTAIGITNYIATSIDYITSYNIKKFKNYENMIFELLFCSYCLVTAH